MTTWLSSEDVHLVEIFLDRDYASARTTDAAFQRCSLAILDATDGSPHIAIWTNVVGPLFNNFDNYHPEPHFLVRMTLFFISVILTVKTFLVVSQNTSGHALQHFVPAG